MNQYSKTINKTEIHKLETIIVLLSEMLKKIKLITISYLEISFHDKDIKQRKYWTASIYVSKRVKFQCFRPEWRIIWIHESCVLM